MKNFISKTTQLARMIVSEYLDENSIAIDCTVGNGADTLFLCQHSKLVYGFDIQKIAIENSEKLLKENKQENYYLINDSFENISNYVSSADVIMFNLGYLPNGDKSITTTSKVTIKGIEQALKVLNVNGLISIISYWGHEQGKAEREALLEMVKQLDSHKYHVGYFSFPNQPNCPPEIIMINRKC